MKYGTVYVQSRSSHDATMLSLPMREHQTSQHEATYPLVPARSTAVPNLADASPALGGSVAIVMEHDPLARRKH
jgi:hypothetical protein